MKGNAKTKNLASIVFFGCKVKQRIYKKNNNLFIRKIYSECHKSCLNNVMQTLHKRYEGHKIAIFTLGNAILN